MLSYNRANRAVAVLCNHQRAVPKTHDKSMANLQAKIDQKTEEIEKVEKEFKKAKKEKLPG
jgi:DNA topoisomerase-1